MRVAFAGTPDFARAALARLHADGHPVVQVWTQPDRPAGRGLKLQASPVKQFALDHGLPVAQPRGLKLDGRFTDDAAQARDLLSAAQPDVMVVAAYGLILPAWVLALPRLGCLNIHASLLPRWRGAAPIQRAIEAGDALTGVCIMQMEAGLDTGPVLQVGTEAIHADDTSGRLLERLAALGASLIADTVRRLAEGPLPATAQPADGITYAHKIDKAEAAIDWRQPARQIERRLRAFDPFPGSLAVHGDTPLKIWRGEVVDRHGAPGEVLALDPDGPVVACGEQALRLLELQRPGGVRQRGREALAAGRWRIGERLV